MRFQQKIKWILKEHNLAVKMNQREQSLSRKGSQEKLIEIIDLDKIGDSQPGQKWMHQRNILQVDSIRLGLRAHKREDHAKEDFKVLRWWLLFYNSTLYPFLCVHTLSSDPLGIPYEARYSRLIYLSNASLVSGNQ